LKQQRGSWTADSHRTIDVQVLMTSMYYDNWITVFPFIPQEDGSAAFYINAGSKPLAAHDVADIGASAAGDTLAHQILELRASAVNASYTWCLLAMSEVPFLRDTSCSQLPWRTLQSLTVRRSQVRMGRCDSTIRPGFCLPNIRGLVMLAPSHRAPA
jgi:hypothetical protein